MAKNPSDFDDLKFKRTVPSNWVLPQCVIHVIARIFQIQPIFTKKF